MKRILFSFSLLLMACNGFAQKGFGVDGIIGMGRNDGDLVYPLLLEGRLQFNDFFSINLGLGLWNSGLKGNWEDPKSTTTTLYNISSNKTLPSLQLGTRGQIPVFRFNDKQVRFFVEPKLYFLPFSAKTVDLREIHYDIKTDGVTGDKTYEEKETYNESMKSDCHPRLYGGIQVGLTFPLIDNIDLAISYGYSNMDLFKDLRGKTITDHATKDWSLNPYLPRTDLQLLNVGFLVNFDLN